MATTEEAKAAKFTAQLEKFGQDVVFVSSSPSIVRAIVYRSSTQEARSPGSVEAIQFRLSDLAMEPIRGDSVEVGPDAYLIDGRIDPQNDGSAKALLRKQ